jgi:hypothetical protein
VCVNDKRRRRSQTAAGRLNDSQDAVGDRPPRGGHDAPPRQRKITEHPHSSQVDEAQLRNILGPQHDRRCPRAEAPAESVTTDPRLGIAQWAKALAIEPEERPIRETEHNNPIDPSAALNTEEQHDCGHESQSCPDAHITGYERRPHQGPAGRASEPNGVAEQAGLRIRKYRSSSS